MPDLSANWLMSIFEFQRDSEDVKLCIQKRVSLCYAVISTDRVKCGLTLHTVENTPTYQHIMILQQ